MASTASPDDVKGVIATDLSLSRIQDYLDDATYEAGKANPGYSEWDTEDKKQLEKYLAALKIRLYADKAIKSTSRETASVDYEGMTTAELKRAVEQRDPSGTLASQRDTSRYVGST